MTDGEQGGAAGWWNAADPQRTRHGAAALPKGRDTAPLCWGGLGCTQGQPAQEATTASASAGRRAGAVGSTSWPLGQDGLS